MGGAEVDVSSEALQAIPEATSEEQEGQAERATAQDLEPTGRALELGSPPTLPGKIQKQPGIPEQGQQVSVLSVRMRRVAIPFLLATCASL